MWRFFLIDGLAFLTAIASLIGFVQHDYDLMIGAAIMAATLGVLRLITVWGSYLFPWR